MSERKEQSDKQSQTATMLESGTTGPDFKDESSTIWIVRFDAPECLTKETFLGTFGDTMRVAGRVMLSKASTKAHPNGYRHMHAVVEARVNAKGRKSPIRKSRIWNAISKMLGEKKGQPPSSRYICKPLHGVTAAVDYCLKGEKRDEKGNLHETAVSEVWANCDKRDFSHYGENAKTLEDLRCEVLIAGTPRRELYANPEWTTILASRSRYVDDLYAQRMEDQFAHDDREVKTVYLYGPSSTGKTTAVSEWLASEGFSEVDGIARCGSFIRGPFDNYEGQPVLLIEDLRITEDVLKQVPFDTWLGILDTKPVLLPARYFNH